MKLGILETVPGVWKKWTPWAMAILTAAWAAVAIVWANTDPVVQQEVLADWGLQGQSSGKLFFYFSVLSGVTNAVLLAMRTTVLPGETPPPALPPENPPIQE